jgi:hypothetical protein
MGGFLQFQITAFMWAVMNGKRTATFLHGRDHRKKREAKFYNQEERPDILIYPETGLFDIRFGLEKFLRSCQPRIRIGKTTYTPVERNEEHRLKLVKITEVEQTRTGLGKVKETRMEWSISAKEKRLVTKIYTSPDSPFIQFKLLLPWAWSFDKTRPFKKPIVEFPWFVNDSSNTNILTWETTKFAPPRTEFQFATAPVVMYDDELNAFVFSSLDNFFVTGIHKADRSLSCGLAGSVTKVPADFVVESVLYFGRGINDTLEGWGALFRRRHVGTGGGKVRDPYGNPITAYLGYNTDNGSYYYYNTEKGKNYEDTMIAIRARHKQIGLPIGYYELDSFWYPKSFEKLPALLKIFVSGSAMHWGEPPKPDIFPHGLKYLWDSLDNLPLMCHGRWFSPMSHYTKEYEFYVQPGRLKSFNLPLFAIPKHEDFWDDLFESAKNWGLSCYLQDWFSYQYDQIDAMKSDVSFAESWTQDMAKGAAKAGMTLQYCMAPSCFFMQAAKIPNVVQARASDDHNGMQPRRWYHPHFTQTSMLARAVGIWPHKDTFFSSNKKVYGFYREKKPEMECLAAALSGGPVAPSDKIGDENLPLLMKTCRTDGLLLKPDRPATPIDLMFKEHVKYYITSTESTKPSGLTWRYVHVANLWPKRVKDKGFCLADLGIMSMRNHAAFLHWSKSIIPLASPVASIDLDLAYEGQELVVLAPEILPGIYFFGNPDKFVSCSNKQFTDVVVDDDGIAIISIDDVPAAEVTLLFYYEKVVPDIEGVGPNIMIDDAARTVKATANTGADGRATVRVNR